MAGNLDKTLNRVKNIIDHMGLHFHRFLSSKIKLFLSIVNLDDLENSTPNSNLTDDPMPKIREVQNIL